MNGLRTYKPMRARQSFGGSKPRVLSWGKIDTRSKIEKGPWRCDAHLRRVRAERCLGCGRSGAEAHHCRKLNGPGWGQPPDWLAVPLCHACHMEAHEGDGGERGFWERLGNTHIAFIRSFSKEGEEGLRAMVGAVARPSSAERVASPNLTSSPSQKD